ncbi:tyrosine-type recombinase/integrase [Photobacterium leiognathi]|uniref:tyrosine-type recombinase/integrase n=1 Tax=Photobacterium leiognathi TaxID=553611 RepID=UPI0029819E3B|nr:site-specific integrase [Photobacterium leiognathi]
MKQHKTFCDYSEQYLSERVYDVAKSTLRSETSKVKTLNKLIGKHKVADIRHSDIKQLLVKLHERYSNKTINDHLTILRAVFLRVFRDGVIALNPMDGIKNLSVSRPEPNPFSKDELALLTEYQPSCQSGKKLALLGVLTGLRIGELIALAWDDINWNKGELYVRRSRVLNEYKVPKTVGSVRTVELNELALGILREQLKITGRLKSRCKRVLQRDNKQKVKTRLTFVFINSKTQQPFLNAKQYGKTFFTPFLKFANVSHRGASQLRHTFASQCLTAGINKEWIARQMGHTSTAMIDEHYGRWLIDDAPDYASMVSSHLGAVFAQEYDNANIASSTHTPPLMEVLRAYPEFLTFLNTLSGGK